MPIYAVRDGYLMLRNRGHTAYTWQDWRGEYALITQNPGASMTGLVARFPR